MQYTSSFLTALESTKTAGCFAQSYGRYRYRYGYRGGRQARQPRHRTMLPQEAEAQLSDVRGATVEYSINSLGERANGADREARLCIGDEILFVRDSARCVRGSRYTAGGRITEYQVVVGAIAHIIPGGDNDTSLSVYVITLEDGSEIERRSFACGVWRKPWADEWERDGVMAVTLQAAEYRWHQHQVMKDNELRVLWGQQGRDLNQWDQRVIA